MTTSTDRIERSVLLKAPRARVWQALTHAEEFGRWFGADLSGQAFVPGAETRGRITIPGFTHVPFAVRVEQVVPERLFSFRWHPYAVDPAVDYSKEEQTLVTFELEETPEGVLLKTTESGFDKVPAARRAEAFRMNSGGWEAQAKNIESYVTSG